MVPRSQEQVSRYCRRFAEHVIDHLEVVDRPLEIPERLFDVTDVAASDVPEFRNNCRAFMSLLLDLVVRYVDQLKPRASFLSHTPQPT